MIKYLIAGVLVFSIAGQAEARRHHRHHHQKHYGHGDGKHHYAHVRHGKRLARRHRNNRHVAHHRRGGGGASLAGLPAPLVAKVAEISAACPGMHAVSTFRPGARVAGSGHVSLHAMHRAADISGGSYSCAYAHLRGWRGGYSTDSGAVHHIHVSWNPGGREWGLRFAHHGGQYRYAGHRHRHQYAHRRERYAHRRG